MFLLNISHKLSFALSDPRVHLYYEDGVAFVKGKENQYDLIIIDSTDPVGPGEGLLQPNSIQIAMRL